MLRSKATAALMRLKEMDKKYKMRCNEEAQLQSSESTISVADSIVDVPKHSIPGSGDTPCAVPKPKLNIKMPPAHMEHIESFSPDREKESSTLVVTIFDQSVKNSNKASNSNSPSKIVVQTRDDEDRIGPAGEGNLSNTLEVTSHKESQNGVQNTETSISEAVDRASETVSELSREASNQISEDIDIEITMESTTSMDAHSQIYNSASKEISFDAYSNDSFEAVSSNTLTTQKSHESVKLLETSVKSHLEKLKNITEHLQLDKEKTEVTFDTLNTSTCKSTLDESEAVELLAPKVVNIISKSKTDFNKELSSDIKTIETLDVESSNGPIVIPVLQTSTDCSPQSKKHKRKQKSHTVKDIKESNLMESSSSSRQQRLSDASSSRKKGYRRKPRNKSSSEIEGNHVPKLLPPYQHKKASSDETSHTTMDIAILFTRKDEKIKDDEGIVTSSISSMHAGTVLQNNTNLIRSKTNEKEFVTTSQQQPGDNSNTNITRVLHSLNQEAIATMTETKVDQTEITKLSDYITLRSPRNYANYQMHKTSVIQPVPVTRLTRVTKGLRSNEGKKLLLIDKCNDDNRYYDNGKTVKSRKKIKSSTSTKPQSSVKLAKDEKSLRYKSKDVEQLQAKVTAMNLEREQDQFCKRISRYMRQLEVEKRRLMLWSTKKAGSEKVEPLTFKPLDFPKITGFTPPFETTYENMKSKVTSPRDYSDVLRDRILEIRQWLKDQFILYRHYSMLVSAINAKYIPTTLEDAKKMICDMQTTSNTAR